MSDFLGSIPRDDDRTETVVGEFPWAAWVMGEYIYTSECLIIDCAPPPPSLPSFPAMFGLSVNTRSKDVELTVLIISALENLL